MNRVHKCWVFWLEENLKKIGRKERNKDERNERKKLKKEQILIQFQNSRNDRIKLSTENKEASQTIKIRTMKIKKRQIQTVKMGHKTQKEKNPTKDS